MYPIYLCNIFLLKYHPRPSTEIKSRVYNSFYHIVQCSIVSVVHFFLIRWVSTCFVSKIRWITFLEDRRNPENNTVRHRKQHLNRILSFRGSWTHSFSCHLLHTYLTATDCHSNNVSFWATTWYEPTYVLSGRRPIQTLFCHVKIKLASTLNGESH